MDNLSPRQQRMLVRMLDGAITMKEQEQYYSVFFYMQMAKLTDVGLCVSYKPPGDRKFTYTLTNKGKELAKALKDIGIKGSVA